MSDGPTLIRGVTHLDNLRYRGMDNVSIKLLNWKDGHAFTPFGYYAVSHNPITNSFFVREGPDDYFKSGFQTEDEAKEAAQKHFDELVMECLE